MLEAPLNTVLVIRLKSACTGLPSVYLRALGTTVQPSRTPVKPAYLLKELVSIATSSAPACVRDQSGTFEPERLVSAWACAWGWEQEASAPHGASGI